MKQRALVSGAIVCAALDAVLEIAIHNTPPSLMTFAIILLGLAVIKNN